MKKILRLDYPPTVVGQPVVYHLVEQFRLTVNILRANVQPHEGWLVIEVEGSMGALAASQVWLLEQGLNVKEVLSPDIQE